jgi:hypothetical protein
MELFAAEATVADVNLRLRLYMLRLSVFLEAKNEVSNKNSCHFYLSLLIKLLHMTYILHVGIQMLHQLKHCNHTYIEMKC